jgi:hypothetical protein
VTRCRPLFLLGQDAFSLNHHLGLNLCVAVCPDAKPVSTFAGHVLGSRIGDKQFLRAIMPRLLSERAANLNDRWRHDDCEKHGEKEHDHWHRKFGRQRGGFFFGEHHPVICGFLGQRPAERRRAACRNAPPG